LQEYKGIEEENFKAQAKELVNKSIEHVRSKLAADKALRSSLVSQAIDNLGQPVRVTGSDPLVGLFNEYLESKGKTKIRV
jgi:hypothetical protein